MSVPYLGTLASLVSHTSLTTNELEISGYTAVTRPSPQKAICPFFRYGRKYLGAMGNGRLFFRQLQETTADRLAYATYTK
jgi:hypothetical protein